MHPQEIHHIKTYVVFFVLSTIVIGVLAYLYIPLGVKDNLQSSTVLSHDTPPVESGNNSDSQITSPGTASSGSDDASRRRIRLVQILIRSQKELQLLESQRTNSPQGLDTTSEQKIIQLRAKIATIEKMITEVK